MAFVYVGGTLSANHHARPFMKPFPFAETYHRRGSFSVPFDSVGRKEGTYQITHDASVESRDGDAEYRPKNEEERV